MTVMPLAASFHNRAVLFSSNAGGTTLPVVTDAETGKEMVVVNQKYGLGVEKEGWDRLRRRRGDKAEAQAFINEHFNKRYGSGLVTMKSVFQAVNYIGKGHTFPNVKGLAPNDRQYAEGLTPKLFWINHAIDKAYDEQKVTTGPMKWLRNRGLRKSITQQKVERYAPHVYDALQEMFELGVFNPDFNPSNGAMDRFGPIGTKIWNHCVTSYHGF